jgi:hypothetical protein
MYVIAEISNEERKTKLAARPNLSQFLALNPFAKPSPLKFISHAHWLFCQRRIALLL